MVRALITTLSLLLALAGCQSGGPADNGAQAQTAPATSQPPPPTGTDGASVRARATMNISTASVMRVAAAATVTPGPRLAGYLVRADSEQALAPPLLDELLALLRAPGFDDSIVNRCQPGTSVGFRLLRRTPGAPEQFVGVVVDFGCNKLLIAEPAVGEAGHSTSFEPSRAAFLALVRRALPKDTTLTTLR